MLHGVPEDAGRRALVPRDHEPKSIGPRCSPCALDCFKTNTAERFIHTGLSLFDSEIVISLSFLCIRSLQNLVDAGFSASLLDSNAWLLGY